MPSFKFAFSALVLLAATSAQAAETSYCSTQNTGASNSKGTNIYNSQGACLDKCGGYKYSVTQNQGCWCSNDKPSSTVAVQQCDQKCPGYPNDTCGNANQNLFSYVEIEGQSNGYGGIVTPASGAMTAATATTSSARNGTVTTPTPIANGTASSGGRQSSGTASGSAATYTGSAAGVRAGIWSVLSIGVVLGGAVGYVL